VCIKTPTNRPAKIVALHAEVRPAQYRLESDICVLGRADVCQIVIPNKIVSRIQAVIERDESGNHILRDSNSANGTYVNGQRLRKTHLLKDRDEIGLGGATALLRFEVAALIIPNEEA
jgi:pSer/pThr/pTyr-binding forkhead associated (FHA) protein